MIYQTFPSHHLPESRDKVFSISKCREVYSMNSCGMNETFIASDLFKFLELSKKKATHPNKFNKKETVS